MGRNIGTEPHAEVSWNATDVISIARKLGIIISYEEAAILLIAHEDEIQIEEIRVGENLIKDIVSHLKTTKRK